MSEILDKLTKRRRLTRRDFLASATALGISLSSATAIWNNAAAATTKKGGHLVAGIGGANTIDSLDPQSFSDTFMITVGFSTRDNLVTVAGDNSLQGGLAERWEPSKGATTWAFDLRKGVEFSNGKSLDVEDVIASINLHRGEDSKSGAKGILAGIEEISADGKHRLIFKLKSGDADFPFILSDYHLNILPSKDGVADWRSGIGTGAYILEQFDPGVRATFKLNPNRWQQDVGFVDSAELVAINDTNARQSALIGGAVDVINKPDLRTISLLERNPALQIVDVPGRIWHVGVILVDKDPYNDNHLRLALKHGIDREGYLRKVLQGYGTLGNDHPLGPAYRYHAADIPQRSYDPDKARFHMKKAGYDGRTLELYTAELFPGMVGATELYQQDAKKAGLNIEIVRRPADGWFSNIWRVKPFQWGWWGPRITEDLMLSIAFLSDAAWNDTGFKSQRLDELIIGARAELDETKRAAMYREAQVIIRDQGGHVVPAFANLVQVVSGKVGVPRNSAGGWNIAGSWELDGGHFVKRWWKA